MKVEIENLNGHFKKLSIEIPADVVSRKFETHFKGIQSQAALKGFRKGKAPMSLIRETYGPQESARITNDIINEYLNKALLEHSFSPVARPEIDVAKVAIEGAPLSFTVQFENLPPVELKEYKTFKAEKPHVEVGEADIEVTLKDIQQQMTQLEKLDEAAVSNGLVVLMDYEGTENGTRVDSACQKDAYIEPGNGQIIEDFDKSIIGLKKGDTKEFEASFPKKPEEGKDPHPLAGKKIHFKVSVKDVFKKNVPEINDEFAKKLGPFDGLATLKDRIRDDVKKQKEEKARRDIQEKAIEWLIKGNPVSAPETLVNQQIQNLAIEAGMQLQNMGLPQDQIEERLKEWGDEMTGRAHTQVKASLLLGAIAREEKIQVSDEDIRKELGRMAAQMRKDPQELVKDMQEKNMIPGFMRQIQELKALDWLLENSLS